jgi:serine/threonine protein kinase
LFDFGLAKELKPTDLVEAPDSYEATGLTGSRRYMPPEVVRCMNYGFKADVYSFSILFWEICALRAPFANLDASKHFENVIGKGMRPARLPNLPTQLRAMMEEGWSNDPNQRPSFKQICQILQVAVADRAGSSTASLGKRSMHLLNRSLRSLQHGVPSDRSLQHGVPSDLDIPSSSAEFY